MLVSPPPNVIQEISHVCRWLDQIQVMLEGSGWSLNLGVTFLDVRNLLFGRR